MNSITNTIIRAVLLIGLIAPGLNAQKWEVRRLPGNPIISLELLPGKDGDNINGPTLIRVPDWVEGKHGRYYLYFIPG